MKADRSDSTGYGERAGRGITGGREGFAIKPRHKRRLTEKAAFRKPRRSLDGKLSRKQLEKLLNDPSVRKTHNNDGTVTIRW
jgi:hypothetical protein